MSKLKEVLVKKDGVLIGVNHVDTTQEGDDWFNKEYPEGHTVEIIDNPKYQTDESEAAQQALDETQGQVAVIGEEVIELLLSKGVFTLGELKQASQDLLAERKVHKGKL